MAAKPWKVIPLELPVDDKTYTVQPVEYDVGLTLLSVGSKNSPIKATSEDRELFALVMGATWDEMQNDKQSYPVMFRAGMAALQYQTALVTGLDNDAAVTIGEQVWENGLSPEAVAAAMAANPAKTSKPSTSTGTARKTPSRASTRTTTSRKTTPRTAPTKTAPRSTGTK